MTICIIDVLLIYPQYIKHHTTDTDPYLHMSQVLQVSMRVVCICVHVHVYAIGLLPHLIAIYIDT